MSNTTEQDTNTENSLVDRMFAVGAHFGFSKRRRHPSVKPYVFAHKEGTDILDLEKTSALLKDAIEVMRKAGLDGKTVMFVGTKPEVSALVEEYAVKADMPRMTNRWIGGTLTNFPEIQKRLKRLTGLLAEQQSGDLERKYTKKERVILGREMDKLRFNFGGIETMEKLPDMVLLVDSRYEVTAVKEANDLKIPILAVIGSDCDPTKVTYPVIMNDAQRASVNFALSELVSAYQDGRANYVPKKIKDGRERVRAKV